MYSVSYNRMKNIIMVRENNNKINVVNNNLNKREICEKIFVEMMNNNELIRGKVIKRFMLEGGLSENGGSTYYQNFKKKYGLVKEKY